MSDVVSEETAQEFLQLVPHAQYVDVRDAHHMVAGDRNDAFTPPVVAFLRSI
jgi:pimeloyl-ACP methyl ester carboxylesterase